jgi:hypothetical protein
MKKTYLVLAAATVVLLLIQQHKKRLVRPAQKNEPTKPVVKVEKSQQNQFKEEAQPRGSLALVPLVRVDLEPFEVNLAKYYFTEEQLKKLAEEDKEFDEYPHKNRLVEFETSAGTFRIVYCFGRQSVDPEAKNEGGWMQATLQLPNGTWIKNVLDIQKTLEVDGTLYLICRHHVLRWVDNEKMECVVTFEELDGKWAPFISRADRGLLAGRYLTVNKSSESDFGGLLEYREGGWIFHQYDGDYGSWVDAIEEKEGQYVLTLFNGWEHQKGKPPRKVRFNPKEGTFTDL